jgi:hypothetical protein
LSFYQLAADAVVLLHFAFVVFVVLGGALALRWPRVMWVQLPAALWGVLVELGGWVCPLTPLENTLRRQSGTAGYEGDFIVQYLLPALYPAGLTRRWQWALGGFALAINALIYGVILLRHRRARI